MARDGTLGCGDCALQLRAGPVQRTIAWNQHAGQSAGDDYDRPGDSASRPARDFYLGTGDLLVVHLYGNQEYLPSVRVSLFAALKHLVDGVLPIGSANAAYWSNHLGEDVPQYRMPYAVDNNYFQTRSCEAVAGRAELQNELNLDASRPAILFASKLQPRKCCGDLLEAYLQLVQGMAAPPYLVIVGDGEMRSQLERRATESSLEGVRFCGFRNQSEMPRFFDVASVFVLPSRDEPWGLVVNEAMNAGRAVIVSDDVGCQPDLIEDGVEGCVFPAGDIAALTDALRCVLATPAIAAAMGERGLSRIQQWGFEQDIHGLRQAIAQVTRKVTA